MLCIVLLVPVECSSFSIRGPTPTPPSSAPPLPPTVALQEPQPQGLLTVGPASWIDKLRVVDLKMELRSRSLKVSGRKAELQARLRAAELCA